MNDIKTWNQGHFIDQSQYNHWTEEQKYDAEKNENLRVRPSPTQNAICVCIYPDHARWIAQRLNLASELEEMTYRFATGKSDGEEIKKYVIAKLKEIL